MVQSDAIRIAILNKYGGIWIDVDTIIISKEFLRYFNNSDLSMVMDENTGFQYISFIYANKNSIILKDWLKEIILNVRFFDKVFSNWKTANKTKYLKKKLKAWHYLGNGIIDKLLKNVKNKDYNGIDYRIIGVFPELTYFKNNASINVYKAYDLFYFEKGEPQFAINNSKGLIFLHNSWTISKYKRMTKKRFLKQDILLSKLLSKLLYLQKEDIFNFFV